MRGQRPALPVVLAWLAVLAMLFTGLPVLERVAPGSTVMVLQMPMDERPVGGGETAPQEDAPAKPRRVAERTPCADATAAALAATGRRIAGCADGHAGSTAATGRTRH